MARILRVSAETKPKALAAAVAGMFVNENDEEIKLIAIGAGAVNQMVKAVVFARQFAAESDVEIISEPALEDADVEGRIITAVAYVLRV